MINKDEANYRISDDGARRCGTCSMFQAPGSCSLVTGAINPVGVCDYWEPVNTGGGGRAKDWVDPAEVDSGSHEMAAVKISWSQLVKEELAAANVAAAGSTPEGAKVVLPYWRVRKAGKVELEENPISDTEKEIWSRTGDVGKRGSGG